jgi:phosphatidate cytidylyltransferase
MFLWRLLVATLIVAALVGLGWLDAGASPPGLWLMPAAVAFTVTATGEAIALARRGGMNPPAGIVHAANLLIVLAPWAPVLGVMRDPVPVQSFPASWASMLGEYWPCFAAARTGSPWAIGTLPLWVLTVAVMLVFLVEMRRYRTPGGISGDLAAAVFIMVYVGVMLSFAVQLRLAAGLGALASWLIAVKAGDIGAFTAGRLAGRHKIAPLLSPNKTVEGAVGALVFSCLGSWATFTWLVPAVSPRDLAVGPSWGWLPFGLLLGVAGMMGDLAESLLKRDVGCKDSSHWLPGFGGVLDILDSLLVTAPLAWACWYCGLVGR